MINTRLGKFIFRDAYLKKIFNKIYWGKVLAPHPSCFATSEKDIGPKYEFVTIRTLSFE